MDPRRPPPDELLDPRWQRHEDAMPPLEVWAPDLDDWDPSLRVPPRPMRGRLLAAGCAAALTAAGWMVWDQVVLPPPLTLESSQAFAPRRDRAEDAPERHLLPAISISEAANFSGDARPLPPPAPGSWLYEHPERGQTFHQFVRHVQNRPSPTRNTLYLLPLGELDSDERAVLSVTRDFIGVYFNTPTDVLPARPIPKAAFDAGRRQLNARELLEALSEELPEDALGVLAVTDQDLFIPGIDFVFGLGSADLRVATFSLARYGRDFELDGRPQAVLRRSLTVAVHELGHVLNMRHCTEFRCLMNGTSSLREADQHTLHLCPVCIRKAAVVMGFDRYERYERLHEFYTTWSFTEEATFVERRLEAPAL